MKRIQVDNTTKLVKLNIKNTESILAKQILEDKKVQLLITALISNLAEIYQVSELEIQRHLDLGIKVAIGFDYSFDFVKDKFKTHPLKDILQENAVMFKRKERQVEKQLSSKELQSARDLPATETSIFKKLALWGSMLPKANLSWLTNVLNSLK